MSNDEGRMAQQVLEPLELVALSRRAQAATYVRSRAVDEVEAQIFLDMLGIES